MSSTSLEPEGRRVLAQRLRAQQAAGGLKSAELRAIARDAGMSERTLWRWLAQPSPSGQRGRPAYRLSQDDLDAYAAAHGNAAAAWRLRTSAGASAPSLRVFQAA